MNQNMASDKEEQKTLSLLKTIFYMELEMGCLHLHDTSEKMMNMLRKKSRKDWTTEYILKLANDNKIQWIKDAHDPRSFETYNKAMNTALIRILNKN